MFMYRYDLWRNYSVTQSLVPVCAALHSVDRSEGAVIVEFIDDRGRERTRILKLITTALSGTTAPLVLSLSAVLRGAQMHCIRCACAFGNSAVQRRSVHLQHGTRIHPGRHCHRVGLGGVYRIQEVLR